MTKKLVEWDTELLAALSVAAGVTMSAIRRNVKYLAFHLDVKLPRRQKS